MSDKLGVHPDVLKLGLVSFLTDVSSEMIFSVFAIFFTTIAGASTALLGLVEGFADFSASSLDYLAGWLTDKTGKHKVFALSGYGFSTVAKAILLLANSVVALSLLPYHRTPGQEFSRPASRRMAVGDRRARDPGIFVRRAQGPGQGRGGSRSAGCLRIAFVARKNSFILPNLVLGGFCFCRACRFRARPDPRPAGGSTKA